jgi:hypothetical protein
VQFLIANIRDIFNCLVMDCMLFTAAVLLEIVQPVDFNECVDITWFIRRFFSNDLA